MALFGVEIWGWQNKERVDGIQRKYLKWILGLEKRTPNYILRKECKMKEISTGENERGEKKTHSKI